MLKLFLIVVTAVYTIIFSIYGFMILIGGNPFPTELFYAITAEIVLIFPISFLIVKIFKIDKPKIVNKDERPY